MRFSPLDSSEDFMGRRGLRVLYLLYFLSYDVINDVIMSDVDCTPGPEPRRVATSKFFIEDGHSLWIFVRRQMSKLSV